MHSLLTEKSLHKACDFKERERERERELGWVGREIWFCLIIYYFIAALREMHNMLYSMFEQQCCWNGCFILNAILFSIQISFAVVVAMVLTCVLEWSMQPSVTETKNQQHFLCGLVWHQILNAFLQLISSCLYGRKTIQYGFWLSHSFQRAIATCTLASVASIWSYTNCPATRVGEFAAIVAITLPDATATTAKRDSIETNPKISPTEKRVKVGHVYMRTTKNVCFLYVSCVFYFQFYFGVFVSFLFVLQLAIVICMLGAAGSIESYTSCPASEAEGYVWAVSTTRQGATVTIARRATIGTATNTSQIAGLAKVYAPCLCHSSPPLCKTVKTQRAQFTAHWSQSKPIIRPSGAYPAPFVSLL